MRYLASDTFVPSTCIENKIVYNPLCNRYYHEKFIDLSIQISGHMYNLSTVSGTDSYLNTMKFQKYDRVGRLFLRGDDILDRIQVDLASLEKIKRRNSLMIILEMTFSIRSGTTYKSDSTETVIYNLKRMI